MEETKVEQKLQKIIENGTPQSVTYNGVKVYVGKKKIEEIKELLEQQRAARTESEGTQPKQGGILPLIALLPLIFGGISAAAGTAAGVAGAVKSAKEAQLADAMKAKITGGSNSITGGSNSITGGSGIYLDSYQGKAISDFLRSINKSSSKCKEFKQVLKKLGKGEMEVTHDGDGLYLKPYKKIGEAQ